MCGSVIESLAFSQCVSLLSAPSRQSHGIAGGCGRGGHSISAYLHEAVANQTHQQLLPPPLFDQRRVLSAVHAREVKHGHVGLAGRVLHKLKVGQFAAGGEVGCVVGIAVQSLVVHVCRSQQLVCVAVVLQRGRQERTVRADESRLPVMILRRQTWLIPLALEAGSGEITDKCPFKCTHADILPVIFSLSLSVFSVE